jgi:hypothetical protein
MNDAITQELGEFYDYIWHDTVAYVYLPVEHEGRWTKFMFAWPRQRAAVIRHTLKWSALAANVFYCPALFNAANPAKENVMGSWVLWVDFDGNAPVDWEGIAVPEPTMRIQSSIPLHEHCYWRLNEFIDDYHVIDDRNRALAYTLHADTSGWDADQILRPIHTTNHKRHVPVTVKQWFE